MFNIFDFKEKNYFRAFLLPSLVTAISATIAIEYNYARKLYFHKKMKHPFKWHLKEIFTTFFYAFIASFIAYIIIHILTGFGNSMLHTKVSTVKDNM